LMVAPDFSQLPWIVPYQDILAIAGTDCVELLEVTNCYGAPRGALPLYPNESANHLKPYRRKYDALSIESGISNLKLRPSVSAGGIEIGLNCLTIP